MEYSETTASKCRYGSCAASLFDGADIIWEHSEADYQGFANVLGVWPDGRVVWLSWTYGSCSGCDEWEYRCLTDEQVTEEMRNSAAILTSLDRAMDLFHLRGGFEHAELPNPNSPTNGSIPGMLQWLSGGWGEDFLAARKALEDYVAKQQE